MLRLPAFVLSNNTTCSVFISEPLVLEMIVIVLLTTRMQFVVSSADCSFSSKTYDDETHPVDITQAWIGYDGYYDDGTEVDVSIECAAESSSTTATSDTDTGSSCSTVEVESAGVASGVYKKDGDVYSWKGGSDIYEIFINSANGAWTIEPTVYASYPKYETFDDVAHPADITLVWIGYDSAVDDGTETTELSITCTDDEVVTSVTCTEIVVENAVDELSGIYTYQWDPCTDSLAPGEGSQVYTMTNDDQVYTIYLSAYTGAWNIEPTEYPSYPMYRTFDDAQHPADISQNWIGFDSAVDDGTEISNLSIECAGDSPVFSSINTTCVSSETSIDLISSVVSLVMLAIFIFCWWWCCCHGTTTYVTPVPPLFINNNTSVNNNNNNNNN